MALCLPAQSAPGARHVALIQQAAGLRAEDELWNVAPAVRQTLATALCEQIVEDRGQGRGEHDEARSATLRRSELAANQCPANPQLRRREVNVIPFEAEGFPLPATGRD